MPEGPAASRFEVEAESIDDAEHDAILVRVMARVAVENHR